MILVIKKDKIALIGLIFLLSVMIISLNIASGQNALEVANDNTVKRTIVIDAGHGGEDPGAVSDYSGLKEKDVNLVIAKRVKELLEAENFNVIMTREEDVLKYKEGTKGYDSKRGQDLTGRKKLIDESGADIAVSIHLNKFSQTQYHGAQVFFPPRSEDSKKLADIIQKSLRENIDPDNKREALVKDTKLIILRNLKVPTVIVECGFLSNREEEQKLADKDYQEKLAMAIKEGIVKYFE
ncbi:N-acetylmuramoyl-L-alanine amidase CwlD [Acetivibrio mesophilus]|uniref:N-acetylmuramoyl-L-alanine amidase CwlD n=1 Tax=Acetivibrio mesophilus TaxID=2487273 RepID=A0A4Q0I4D0_9FIRM|nr:N-acetylmuramoyl-L-alanine amidase CwlD [Acetivibrio mesophilus]ODM26586.1 N-acetylmuramoyl-L-alanine amidase CwlD [Clostridium sp. Bc-iso-3]RXE58575.1 N-acetylmuramoyl-L-alanine amidase CwlD [Acetivibrio mesophilus]HHV29755.1 N-acetylmuramoyl-L-alanine amidase CwlD [Clostridium sp.]